MRGLLCVLVLTASCQKSAVVKARLANVSLASNVSRDVGDSASSTTSGLQELKYVFGSMQLCETLTVDGSRFTGSNSCVTLYDSGLHIDLDTITLATLPQYESNAVDLASAASIAAFNAKANGSVAAGSYNYVTVNWAPLIAAKAQVTVGDTTVSTQACTLDTTGLCTSATSMNSATGARSMIVQSANGGTWF